MHCHLALTSTTSYAAQSEARLRFTNITYVKDGRTTSDPIDGSVTFKDRLIQIDWETELTAAGVSWLFIGMVFD